MSDAELIHAAIEASGLDASSFARSLLGRDPRTVRRWKAGSPIPPHARQWLALWVALGEETRANVVRAMLRTAKGPAKGGAKHSRIQG